MFHPVNDFCVSCSRAVQKHVAQQLVLKNGEWRRQHQDCFDKETKKIETERRQLEITPSSAS